MYLITTAINDINNATTIDAVNAIVEDFEMDVHCDLAESYRGCGPDDLDDHAVAELVAELDCRTLQGYATLRKNALNHIALAAAEYEADTSDMSI